MSHRLVTIVLFAVAQLAACTTDDAGAPSSPPECSGAKCDSKESTTCGGEVCGADQYCFLESGTHTCGSTELDGVCTDRASGCSFFHEPVCGCDGVSYWNSCEASRAGAGIDHGGECAPPLPPSQTCGGETCGANEFCWLDFAAVSCGAADAHGLCTPTSETCPTFVLPVCGCDGITYDNSCVASKAGVGIASQGACPTQP